MILYLDTSTLVELYVDKEGSPQARAAVEAADVVARSRLAFAEAHAPFTAAARPVAEALAYLASIKLPPHQLQKLGLPDDWNKNVSCDFVRRVCELIERYRPLLEELAKY
ncbi:hypothetical protein [Geochorda subterranea]|uniref:PIN domain-containing protein n=1 Tax=Geochorda subterranea TaxID=3109564 RepID=A0ABZ1BSW7_9FIRM|nr:hypothetical protein [Limnochorda sp. LNt]WRP15859.1 hypothetical protein VLY81_06830 [Limnochorda sp. LNt]